MLEHVRTYIDEHHLLTDGQPVLVGVSGGLDSTTLLHVLIRLGYAVHVAHINYGLRGAESEADEAFVRALCAEVDVPVHIYNADPTSLKSGAESLQATARAARYKFFAEVARAEEAPAVAVAHHRDDQIETVLLHLTRGAGPEGLAGMPPQRPLRSDSTRTLVRPLLGTWREDIAAYADEVGLSWREDASNDRLAYQRNVVRHQILPMMEEMLGSSVRAPMARSAELMRSYVDNVLRPQIARRFHRAAVEKGDGGLLRADALLQESSTLRQRLVLEALARWLPTAPRSAAVAKEVAGLIGAEVGGHVEFGEGAVWRTREGLRFRPEAKARARTAPTALRLGTTVELPRCILSLDVLDDLPEDLAAGGDDAAYVDLERLTLPLTVRTWRSGDRIQPLGMTGTKRVSDLLTDARVPPYDRPHVLVVASAHEIVWVVGLRLSEHVKVRPTTRRIGRIAVIPFSSESETG